MEINCIFWCYPKIQRVVGYFWFLLELPVELSSNCCTWRFCDRTPLSGGEIKGCWWPSTIGDQKVNKLIRLVAVFSKLHVQVSLFVSCNLQRLRSFSSNMTCQKMPHPKNYCQMRMIFEGVNFWEVFFFQPFLGEFRGISSCYEPAFFEAHVGNSRGEEVVGRQWLVVWDPKKRCYHHHRITLCRNIKENNTNVWELFHATLKMILFSRMLEVWNCFPPKKEARSNSMVIQSDLVILCLEGTEYLKGPQVTVAIFTKLRNAKIQCWVNALRFWKIPLPLSNVFAW